MLGNTWKSSAISSRRERRRSHSSVRVWTPQPKLQKIQFLYLIVQIQKGNMYHSSVNPRLREEEGIPVDHNVRKILKPGVEKGTATIQYAATTESEYPRWRTDTCAGSQRRRTTGGGNPSFVFEVYPIWSTDCLYDAEMLQLHSSNNLTNPIPVLSTACYSTQSKQNVPGQQRRLLVVSQLCLRGGDFLGPALPRQD